MSIHNLEVHMKATIVDLRYKMNEVLKALERREKVTILYHGKVKGTIMPTGVKKPMNAEDHPFFKMNEQDNKSVAQQMEELRGSRFNDI
jgi:hypothetical protein